MSFGLDDGWVDPEEEPRRCAECEEWSECPCGCGEGWCWLLREFTDRDDGC